MYIVRYKVGNHILRLRSHIAVNIDFQPYISNENFEYS